MTREEAEKIIKERFIPVEDKPGYVWFSNFQIISIETLAKSLEDWCSKNLYNTPLAESEGQGMSKTIQRPLACRNAHCGAMCSPADASMLGGNPSKCFMYERRDDLYRKNKLLEEIRAEIEQITDSTRITYYKQTGKEDVQYISKIDVLRIIDKYKKGSEERNEENIHIGEDHE